jgi:hypothetical protein
LGATTWLWHEQSWLVYRGGPATLPCLLVLRLALELEPVLILNRTIQAGPGFDLLSGWSMHLVADLLMRLRLRSSIKTSAWFLLCGLRLLTANLS